MSYNDVLDLTQQKKCFCFYLFLFHFFKIYSRGLSMCLDIPGTLVCIFPDTKGGGICLVCPFCEQFRQVLGRQEPGPRVSRPREYRPRRVRKRATAVR